MPALSPHTTTRAFSVGGTFGEITVIAASDHVLIDAQTRNYDTAGHLHRDHSLANLSLSTAARLRDLLNEAIEHAHSSRLDIRQTALWSETARRPA